MSNPATALPAADATAIQFDPVTCSFPPSHILQDGRHVHLPPPTVREKGQFLERSIAKFGLLQADLTEKKTRTEKQGDSGSVASSTTASVDGETSKEKEKPKVHPLALASARLQANGINELNRAINLATLVSTGEYFSLCTIVDPSSEIAATAAAATEGKSASASTSGEGAASASASGAASSSGTATAAAKVKASQPESQELQEEHRVKAAYVLKRKRAQFEKAASCFQRQFRRLQAAVVAQARPDRRLRELRPQWRLVAPEHGTRALPHAARPIEVVACDVDVYWKGSSSATSLGRLAKRVPRYATMEFKDDYSIKFDLKKWQEKFSSLLLLGKEDALDDVMDMEKAPSTEQHGDGMEVDEPELSAGEPNKMKDSDANEGGENQLVSTIGKENNRTKKERTWTRAEPFAIADPTLGKLDADFDPTKVAMLTLQFDIEKASTGFCQSACLESISKTNQQYQEDERILAALQHSLFCAKLFESIRRELAPDTEDIGQIRTTAKAQTVVWLASESEENFLPAPVFMASGEQHVQQGGVAEHGDGAGLASISVIHCHEGEVKVQLDCEYTLRVKLVEATVANRRDNGGGHSNDDSNINNHNDADNTNANDAAIKREGSKNSPPCFVEDQRSSGSQTPAQLLALCRALLLHAQETYHRHSIQAAAVEQKYQQEEENQLQKGQLQPQHLKSSSSRKFPIPRSPRILQCCVSLGSKMLFERRIRQCIQVVNEWLLQQQQQQQLSPPAGKGLTVEWLPLSVFDLHSQFTLQFQWWILDAYITCEEITVTSFVPTSGSEASCTYRKAKFHSDRQLEMYLKRTLRNILKEG